MKIKEAIAMLAEFGKVCSEDCEVEIEAFRLEGRIELDHCYGSFQSPNRKPSYVIVAVLPTSLMPPYDAAKHSAAYP